MNEISEKGMNRRNFLKIGAAAGAAVAAIKIEANPPKPAGEAFTQFRVPPIDPVRIGFVGVGGMGSAHVRNLMEIEGVEIRAVCDIVESKVARIQKWLPMTAGRSPKATPAATTRLRAAVRSRTTSTWCTPPPPGSGTCRSAWRR